MSDHHACTTEVLSEGGRKGGSTSRSRDSVSDRTEGLTGEGVRGLRAGEGQLSPGCRRKPCSGEVAELRKALVVPIRRRIRPGDCHCTGVLPVTGGCALGTLKAELIGRVSRRVRIAHEGLELGIGESAAAGGSEGVGAIGGSFSKALEVSSLSHSVDSTRHRHKWPEHAEVIVP